jgi:hypothetical protein
MGHKSGSCSSLDAPVGVLLVHLSQSYNCNGTRLMWTFPRKRNLLKVAELNGQWQQLWFPAPAA